MNSKNPLLLSLAVNVALAVAVVALWKNRPADAPSGPADNTPGITPPATRDTPRRPVVPPGSASLVTNTLLQKFDWRSVESGDYRKYIENLRAIGCPEETIRDIIIADVNKLFASRKATAKAAGKKYEYWKSGNMFGEMMDEEKIKQQQAASAEKRALLKELLGIEPEEKPDLFAGMNPYETMLDFLPGSKQTQLIELEQKYQARLMKTMQNGQPDEQDMKAMQQMQKDKEAEMAKLLSPEEMEQYQLRLSQTAQMMRFGLAAFDPTEQEFKDVFKLKKKFDDEFSVFGMGTTDDVEQKKRADAQGQLNTQLKTLLGENRYAEYERAQDYNYQAIAKVAEREGLPKESAVKVYDMKKTAEEQSQKVRANPALTEEQRSATLQAILNETKKAVTETLGQKGFDSYQKQPGGYWLKQMVSPANPARVVEDQIEIDPPRP